MPNQVESINGSIHSRSQCALRYHRGKPLICIAEVQDASRIAPHNDWGRGWRVDPPVKYGFAATIVQSRDPPNVVLRLPETGNARTARHRSRAGVISGQAEADVAAIAIQQLS